MTRGARARALPRARTACCHVADAALPLRLVARGHAQEPPQRRAAGHGRPAVGSVRLEGRSDRVCSRGGPASCCAPRALPAAAAGSSRRCNCTGNISLPRATGIPSHAHAHGHAHTRTHTHTPTRSHALTPTHLQTCARAWRRSQKFAPLCKPTYLDRARRFSIWRLNCALAALHAHVTADSGYALEDKWTFLHKAREAGIAVSPWWDASSQVFVSTLSHILAFITINIILIIILFTLTHFRRGGMRPRRSLESTEIWRADSEFTRSAARTQVVTGSCSRASKMPRRSRPCCPRRRRSRHCAWCQLRASAFLLQTQTVAKRRAALSPALKKRWKWCRVFGGRVGLERPRTTKQ